MKSHNRYGKSEINGSNTALIGQQSEGISSRMLHKIVDQHGNVYKGEVLRGKRHGRGTIVYADTRDVYQGDFENDVPHGAGRYFRAGAENGLFEGLWKDGELYQVKKGRACIEDSNGDHYDGGFDHWKRHGKGTLKSANGVLYEGYWKQGLRHGYGILQYNDGTKFEGQFKIDEPFATAGDVDEDGDDKTVLTTASELETMELNPYPTNIEPVVEEREITSSPLANEGRDTETKTRTPEEKLVRTEVKATNDDDAQQKQTKKVKKDVKRKLELLEKAKAEKKGQFQRDRRKYLLDAKKNIEKKRLKEIGESGSGTVKKLGQTEKTLREKSDDVEKTSKIKNGLLKIFQRERSKESDPEHSQKVINDASCIDNGVSKDDIKIEDSEKSCSADGITESRANHQQDATGTSKQAYSSSRPPAHPLLSSNDTSLSLPPSRGRSTSTKTIVSVKTTKSRSSSTKKNKEKSQSIKKEKEKSRSTNRGRSRSTLGTRGADRSPSPFSFFRSRSKSSTGSVNKPKLLKPKKDVERVMTSSNASRSSRARSRANSRASSKASYSSSYSQHSHTLEMLSSSSDSNDPNFVKTSSMNFYDTQK